MHKILLKITILCSSLLIFAAIGASANASILDNIVIVVSPEKNAYGTGFFISPYGHVLTNAHVIAGGRKFQMCYQGSGEGWITCYASDKLKLLAKNSYLDLALLQFPQVPNAYNNHFFTFGNSDSSKIGDEINIFGYPQDNILSLDRAKGLIIATTPEVILTDAKITHGNSGSPVLNKENKVIGIVTGAFFSDKYYAGILISSKVIKDWLSHIQFNPKNSANYSLGLKNPLLFK